MSTNRKLVWIGAAAWVSVALAAMASLSGCGQAQSQDLAAAKVTRVDVSLPLDDEVVDYEEFTGRVDAKNKVGLQAMVTGYLDKIHFVDGQDVHLDDLLFEIDPKIYQANYNKAAASLEQTKARLERVTYDYQRGKTLVQNGSMSQGDFDLVAGDRLEASANAGQARAMLEQADVNLKYTKVRSPMEGRASRRLIDPGNMVKANETMLTWIYQIDPMYGYFDVDERTVIKIRKLVIEGKLASYRDDKMFVDVGLADEEGFSMKGWIDWVDNVLDGGTGTLKVRAVVNQPTEVSSGKPHVLVSPGMFVRMRLPTSARHKALLISEKALGTDQGEKYVLVVSEKKEADGRIATSPDGKPLYIVERRNVTLGQLHRGLRVVEINPPEKGKNLSRNELVVVSGLQRVRAGNEVTIEKKPMPAMNAAPAPIQVQAPALNPALPNVKSTH
jgi:RND family efflux transporter MFP subunit